MTSFNELLERWRKTRHPSTSELLLRIGEKFEVELPPLPPKKGDAARAWVNAVKVEPPAHLTARLSQLERFARSTSTTTLWPVFEALAKVPPDPRIATLVTRYLVQDVEVELDLTDRLVRRLLDCIETHADDTHFRALELGLSLALLGDGVAARAVRVMQRGLAAKPVGPEVPEAERKRLLALDWKVDAEPVAAPVDPFAAVWAAPGDDARKQVLADVLLERGDARGEFISLQLAHAAPKRQQALLKKHRTTWLGGLADIVELNDKRDALLFEKGFVSELSVRHHVRRGQFMLAADAREWATVRRVFHGLHAFSHAMASLEHAGLVPLDAVKGWGREGFVLPLRSVKVPGTPVAVAEALRAAPAEVPWVGALFNEWEPTRQLRDGLPELAQLPGLERLRLGAQAFDVLPAVLKEMGLDWVPKTVTRLELSDGAARVAVLARDGKWWSLTLLDFDPTHRARSWKEALSNLRWLEPTSVRVQLSTEPTGGAEAFEALLRRFKLPVGVTFDALPTGW